MSEYFAPVGRAEKGGGDGRLMGMGMGPGAAMTTLNYPCRAAADVLAFYLGAVARLVGRSMGGVCL